MAPRRRSGPTLNQVCCVLVITSVLVCVSRWARRFLLCCYATPSLLLGAVAKFAGQYRHSKTLLGVFDCFCSGEFDNIGGPGGQWHQLWYLVPALTAVLLVYAAVSQTKVKNS